MIQRRWFLALVSALVIGACGGDDDGGDGDGAGDPISAEDGLALCGDFADHADACGWDGNNVNQADWNCGEATMVWREDVFRAYVACATELACDGDGGECAAAIGDTAPLAYHQEFATVCDARSAQCDLTPMGDASGFLLQCDAGSLALYTGAIVDQITACFDLPCEDVVTCLDDTL